MGLKDQTMQGLIELPLKKKKKKSSLMNKELWAV